jgi:hypothetical protein
MTTDIDATVRGDQLDIVSLLKALAKKRIVPRIRDAERFASESLVLLSRQSPADRRTYKTRRRSRTSFDIRRANLGAGDREVPERKRLWLPVIPSREDSSTTVRSGARTACSDR